VKLRSPFVCHVVDTSLGNLGRGHTILTSRELMWCYACSWDVTGDLTLNSTAQIHTSITLLTSRDLTLSSGRLTCQHASHISVVAHISWDVTPREVRCHDNRNMRGVLARHPTRAQREITWRKQSDRSVNLRRRVQCQIASHIPTARVTSHELMWREDSVSPALLTYLITYLLSRWIRVLLEKTTGSQPVKKFPAFYGTQRSIIAFTSTRHISLS
jgi:hypothetical protein